MLPLAVGGGALPRRSERVKESTVPDPCVLFAQSAPPQPRHHVFGNVQNQPEAVRPSWSLFVT
jgi:hypothetical protein